MNRRSLSFTRSSIIYFSIISFFFFAPFVFAQTTLASPVTTSGIVGIPYASILIGIRFLGALWAAVGIAYFTSGLIDYMLSHENAHHKAAAQLKISKGLVTFAYFFATWAIVKLLLYFIF